MYPPFVFGKRVHEEELPIFVFHRVTGSVFVKHVEYIQKNGYQTLTADEAVAFLNGKATVSRPVLLTFDDGTDDLYHDVFPLLREHQVRVVSFLAPAWIGQSGYLTEAQVLEMHESGWVDFQSHSQFHAAIPVSDKPVRFVTAKNRGKLLPNFFAEFDAHGFVTGFQPVTEGLPVYRVASRMGDRPRKMLDFKQDSRQVRSGSSTASGAKEIPDRQKAAIQQELLLSKAHIETLLPGKTVSHFAYPWFEWGHIAESLIGKTGYVSSMIGLKKKRRTNRIGEGTRLLTRVSGDFIPALPGAGRKHYRQIMFTKLRQRLLS